MPITKHNEQMSKNRYITSEITDVIRFYDGFQLVLRGHDESESWRF